MAAACFGGALAATVLMTLVLVEAFVRNNFHPLIVIYSPLYLLPTFFAGGAWGLFISLIIVPLSRRFNSQAPFQFKLRSLLILLTVASVGMSVFARWHGEFEELEHYSTGSVMHRRMMYRNWRGEVSLSALTSYYPTGQTCFEFRADWGPCQMGSTGYFYVDRLPTSISLISTGKYFLPDGTEVPIDVFLDHGHSGTSAHHPSCLINAPRDLVWCMGEKIWRKRRASDLPGRIQP
jgi:hypothetical protein